MHHQFCDRYLVRMDHKLARDYFTRFYSLTNYMDGYGRNATHSFSEWGFEVLK